MESSPRKPLYPIKPFHKLDRAHQEEILKWKNRFSEYNQTLCVHLDHLAVPQLEPFLSWIPPNELEDLQRFTKRT